MAAVTAVCAATVPSRTVTCSGPISAPSPSLRRLPGGSAGCWRLLSPKQQPLRPCGSSRPPKGTGAATLVGARAEVKYVLPEEVKELLEDGYSVVDIRDSSQYNRAHIVPSVHVPYFIENNDSDPGTQLARVMHNGFAGALYGIAYTKVNQDFVSTLEKQFQKDSKLLLVCQEGLRSGTASKKLEEAGFSNVAYVSSGLVSVPPGIFIKEGPRELKDAGKAGLVSVQTQISTVLGSVLVAAWLFLTLFPDQAEKLFFSK